MVDRLDVRPDEVWADRGYDAKANRDGLTRRHITAMISQRNRPGAGKRRDPLGRHRWPIERTNAWLHSFRRVSVRYERRAELYLALAQLACSLILCRYLEQSF